MNLILTFPKNIHFSNALWINFNIEFGSLITHWMKSLSYLSICLRVIIMPFWKLYFSKAKGKYTTCLKVWMCQFFFKYSRCYFMENLTSAYEKMYSYLALIKNTSFAINFQWRDWQESSNLTILSAFLKFSGNSLEFFSLWKKNCNSVLKLWSLPILFHLLHLACLRCLFLENRTNCTSDKYTC